MRQLEQRLEFISEAGRLKGVIRQTILTDPARRENSAEHSWHLAVMALALAQYAPPGTDISKVTSMVLIHDVVEVDAGDLFVYASAAEQERQEVAERAAADRIFGLLPPGQAEHIRALWDEFEERRTPEARFARALDRFQPLLANIAADGGTWREHGTTADQVLTKVQLIEDGSPELGRYARELVEQAVRDGILAAAPAAGPPGAPLRR